MLKIEKLEEIYYLKDENEVVLKFYEDKVEIVNINNSINRIDFGNLINNSSLKDLEIFCSVTEESEKEIKFLGNLGFDFYGISFNPKTNQTEEIYKYKYKDIVYIKDNELEEILKKLEQGKF